MNLKRNVALTWCPTILVKQVKTTVVTSLILIGLWKSNLLGASSASSATLPLNTLGVLITSVYHLIGIKLKSEI